MMAYFGIGRKFRALKKNQDGDLEEIDESIIIEYVNKDNETVLVEIDKGEITQIVTIQSKYSSSKKIYFDNDLKNITKKSKDIIEKSTFKTIERIIK